MIKTPEFDDDHLPLANDNDNGKDRHKDAGAAAAADADVDVLPDSRLFTKPSPKQISPDFLPGSRGI